MGAIAAAAAPVARQGDRRTAAGTARTRSSPNGRGLASPAVAVRMGQAAAFGLAGRPQRQVRPARHGPMRRDAGFPGAVRPARRGACA